MLLTMFVLLQELRNEQDEHRVEKRRAQALESTVKNLKEEISDLQIQLTATEADLIKERNKFAQPSEAVLRAQDAIDALEIKLKKSEDSAQMYLKQLQSVKEDQGETGKELERYATVLLRILF